VAVAANLAVFGHYPFAPIPTSRLPATIRCRKSSAEIRFDSEPGKPAALPEWTFDRSLTVRIGGEEINVLHFPNGHTDGDSVVFFAKAKVVHMGDILSPMDFRSWTIFSGGTVNGMVAAGEGVIAKVPADTKVIPGAERADCGDRWRRFPQSKHG
jgi:cyclase